MASVRALGQADRAAVAGGWPIWAGAARSRPRGPESLGWRLFLTLGGHGRSGALTSLAYFRCSGPQLENGIRRSPPFDC